MKTAFLAVGLAALLAAPALADVVTLTDGSKREGKVIREDDKFVTLEIVQGRMRGEMVFNREKVKSIERGPTAAEKLQAEV